MVESNQATYTIDPVTLREKVTSYADAERYIGQLVALGPDGDATRVSWLRMAGRLDEAETLGWHMLIERNGADEERNIPANLPVGAITSALRLAHVLHWKEEWDSALQLFNAALSASLALASTDEQTARTLEAFTWQHLGKFHFDQGSLLEAQDCFRQALAFRTNLGRPADEIESCRLALATVTAQLRQCD